MLSATVTILKSKLSQFLAHVKAGEDLIITEHNKPIARIIPFAEDLSALPPHLIELERAGLAKIGSGELPPGFWDLPRPKDAASAGLDALKEERGAER